MQPAGALTTVQFDDKVAYELYLLEEVDRLTNLLQNFAIFKRRFGQYWPSRVVIHSECRLARLSLSDMPVRHMEWTLRDGIYNWLYKPFYDPHNDERTPTIFTGTRTPPIGKKSSIYRERIYKGVWKGNGDDYGIG